MLKKFTAYQHLLLSEVHSSMPQELGEFFQLQLGQQKKHIISEGSIQETHIDALSLFEYLKNRVCPLSNINAVQLNVHITSSRRYQKLFTHEEVMWLSEVYKTLYPSAEIGHVPILHETFNELTVFGNKFLSDRARGNHSAVICAYWSFTEGYISSEELHFEKIYCFFRHSIVYDSKKVAHIFARVHWFKSHPKKNWFNHHLAVIDSDLQNSGPVTFMPISRVFGQCAIVANKIKFDYGYDSVCVAMKLSHNFFI